MLELLDGNATITQYSGISINIGNGAGTTTGVAVALIERDITGGITQLADVQCLLFFLPVTTGSAMVLPSRVMDTLSVMTGPASCVGIKDDSLNVFNVFRIFRQTLSESTPA